LLTSQLSLWIQFMPSSILNTRAKAHVCASRDADSVGKQFIRASISLDEK
jgi:hypothetical protein